ncbi:MAG: hypothetical protein ACT4OD_04445, partial [Candidatus Nitrosotenuis sp.]
MNNEIGRKITSLTLMTIMLAAGFSAFAPSTMPEAAAANANLFVSAENSQFQNYFAGPMVIEVAVIDSDIKDTDEAKGEPDVTVNGKDLRMVQAVDGNWYAYFADRAMAQTADQTARVGTVGFGLDFGTFCANTRGQNVLNITLTDTNGFAIPLFNASANGIGGSQGTNSIVNSSNPCTPGINTNNQNVSAGNVVREAKEPTARVGTTVQRGQIGLNGGGTTSVKDAWPFIQLYEFNPTGNVVIQYNKGGGVQSTTLKFDTVDQFAKLDLDRSSYPRGAQVHATITDLQLNIDPTDEDSWTFAGNATTNSTTGAVRTVYQAFNENGGQAGDGNAGGIKDVAASLSSLMFEDNGLLNLVPDVQNSGTDIVQIQDNADTVITLDTRVSDAASQAQTTGGASTHGKLTRFTYPLTFTENGPNTGIFGSYDEGDVSTLEITSTAPRGKSASIDYNETPKSIVVGFGFAAVDIKPVDAEWNSGEEITVSVTDSDANKNSRADEDLDLNNPDVSLIPSLRIGDPFTLGENGTGSAGTIRAKTFETYAIAGTSGSNQTFRLSTGQSLLSVTVDKFSDRAILTANSTTQARGVEGLALSYGKTADDLANVVFNTTSSATKRLHGFNFFNYDIRGLNSTLDSNDVAIRLAYTNSTLGLIPGVTATASNSFRTISISNNTGPQGLINLNDTAVATVGKITRLADLTLNRQMGIVFTLDAPVNNTAGTNIPVVADFFSFGYFNDGLVKTDRVNNMIVRIEAEENGDNTGVFDGALEFVILNQLNILDATTYSGLSTIADDPSFIVHQDLDDEEAPRVNYNDLGADGVVTQVADQEDAPTHSGVVSFNQPTYKKADTVVVTLEDQDLNTDVDLIDIYTSVNSTSTRGGSLFQDSANDRVGKADLPTLTNGDALGRLLDITFDDAQWRNTNNACSVSLISQAIDNGLFSTGFTLIETGSATGIFTGDFQVPGKVCVLASGVQTSPANTQGLDMEVNYVDFRDASGQIVEVGDGAGIRANTGSISLDRTVYPVPFGDIEDYDGISVSDTSAPGPDRSLFPIHLTGIGTNGIDSTGETLDDGILVLHVQVNDPDFDTSAAGEDVISENVTSTNRGPVKITVSRGQSDVILGYAGGTVVKNGVMDVNADNTSTGVSSVRQLGPITETAPNSGIFEFDLQVLYTDGPASATCPTTGTSDFESLLIPGTVGAETTRFDTASTPGDYCILQGDIITVEYTDPADASGDVNTVTDSATFDLRNGALQSDKSVYIIGSDMILTLIEPDLDLDNDLAETYDLDLIEWDSDAATTTMGSKGGATNAAAFDPEPSDLRETGDSTGIYQTVIEIPDTLSNDRLERGEEIVLEYTDWGPSGADYVGQEDEDINLTVFTSNFGATVELDQKVYTWTDKVYLTVVAPDQNFDSNLVDEIGNTNSDPLKVATRGFNLDNYKLVETGTDTGIFTGEVILTGFAGHDADGDGTTGDASGTTNSASGPTDGLLSADDDDGLTVSYEFSEDETVVGSALVRWNIGEVSWLEASYPASGTGVVRIIDPDMNLNPESVDNFDADVWS